MAQDLLRDDRYLCPKCGKRNDWRPNNSYLWLDYAIIAALFVTLGAILEKWAAKGPVYQYENVKILKRHDDFHFRLHIAGMAPVEAEICKDYKPDWIEGCFLAKLKYEDRGACWSFNAPDLGYIYRHDDDGNDLNEKGEVCWRN